MLKGQNGKFSDESIVCTFRFAFGNSNSRVRVKAWRIVTKSNKLYDWCNQLNWPEVNGPMLKIFNAIHRGKLNKVAGN